MFVTKFISLYQTVSTELTLVRNSVEIDKKGHIIIENRGKARVACLKRKNNKKA